MARTSRSTAKAGVSVATAPSDPASLSGPRNLVICCDGTGNDVSGNLSSIFLLYRCVVSEPNQVSYYDPGVGTFSQSTFWKWVEDAERVVGLAFGFGLDENVLDAYRFLVENWREGDRVFLFGFSRGAYTARVLAGMVRMVGLLRPHQLNLAPYALKVYRAQNGRGGVLNKFYNAERFIRSTNGRKPQMHFMGLWDTVNSVIEFERSAFLYWPRQQEMPFTNSNRQVKTIRHALAIDERRRMFRPSIWSPDKPLPPGQDHRALWFAGVHSDIGGGYDEATSGLSKIPLVWMLDEARRHGLRVTQTDYERVVLGQSPTRSNVTYVGPDPACRIHDSLSWAWRVLEWIPRRASRSEDPAVRARGGWYLPRGERRHVPPEAQIHASVRTKLGVDPSYRPTNLPAQPSYVDR